VIGIHSSMHCHIFGESQVDIRRDAREGRAMAGSNAASIVRFLVAVKGDLDIPELTRTRP
jgi:hypothetical protein